MSAKERNKFIVAVKNPGGVNRPITPGRVLGQYRRKEDTCRDIRKLAQRAGFYGESLHVGVFQNGRLLNS